MIICTENCKYQKNGECTYITVSRTSNFSPITNCGYYEPAKF